MSSHVTMMLVIVSRSEWRYVEVVVRLSTVDTLCDIAKRKQNINSYSASHDNWCTATLWNGVITARAGTTSPMPEHKGFMLQ